ncbi:MAG TPA: ribulose-phosphate 3-epimerase [Actinomycetota bacterium]|nr:ribulose-phosphate 3-epimerase [Actinomycetota bacterium]
MARLAASILSANFARLEDEVKRVEPYADLIHVDVMDAHFVPPLTIGPVVVEWLRPVSDLPLHCHLMVEHPERLFADFAEAGTDLVTFHLEAVEDPGKVAAAARAAGMAPGIGINPETDIRAAFPHLEGLDNVIVMTLESTGYAGQPFQESSLRKVEALRSEIDRRGLRVDVIVDGGINEATGARCIEAGATMLAAASSIFRADDPARAAEGLARVAAGG